MTMLLLLLYCHTNRFSSLHSRPPMVAGKVNKNFEVRPQARNTGDLVPEGQRQGGSKQAYPLETRRHSIITHNNPDVRNHPVFEASREAASYPSQRTVRRYNQRQQMFGHIQPFRRSGNKRSDVLRRLDLFLLAIYVRAYPSATAPEKIAFLYSAYGREFEPSQITRAEQRLGLSRKKMCVSSIKAFTPDALALRWMFWNLPPPYGIQGVPRSALIDVDEAKIILDYVNRGYAKAHLEQREVRSKGFSRESGRLVIMAISGSAQGYRKLVLKDQGGTDLETFIEFITEMLQEIGPGGNGNRRVFMMDNLNVHHNHLVTQLIIHAGHELVFRAPYWPKDGPIEYFFNALEGGLRERMYNINDIDDLEERIKDVVRSYNDFVPFFQHLNMN